MIRPRIRSLLLLLLGVVCIAVSSTGADAASAASVKLLPTSGPRSIVKNTVVTFRTQVKGIVLDGRHIGKAPAAGHGHLQIYVDSIPADAWTKSDLRHHWLASLASPTFTLKLSAAILGGTGTHRIIIALAQNNGVLLRAGTATLSVSVKR